MSLFCVVTLESLPSRELSAHILLTSVGRVMLNSVYVGVMDDELRRRALDASWHQLYLLTAAALPLDVLLTTGRRQAALDHQLISV